MMNESDRNALAQRASTGDPDALQSLIVHYHETLHHALADRIVENELRHLDPDDILQDAYVKAFQSVRDASFDGPGGFYKWLETIAVNQLADARRALHRQKRDVARRIDAPPAASTTYPDLFDRIAKDQSTPSRRLRRAEATAAVLTSLARLTDDQRQVIKLRFLQELTVPETAAIMKKSPDAVHMLTVRALKPLKNHLVGASSLIVRA
jgi:RNA polymerase sigma-70 factor (ECF subfamily)